MTRSADCFARLSTLRLSAGDQSAVGAEVEGSTTSAPPFLYGIQRESEEDLVPPTLTHHEVEELIEQLSLRPTMWSSPKEKLWVRKLQKENLLAVKIVNGLPHNMSTMYTKVLSEAITQEEAERRMLRVITFFTSYGWRKRVETLLEERLAERKHRSPGDVEDLAREICDMDVERAWRSRSTDTVPTLSTPPIMTERVQELHEEAKQAPAEQVKTVSVPFHSVDQSIVEVKVVKRSKFLESLLKGRKS